MASCVVFLLIWHPSLQNLRPTLANERYIVERCIGRGGMGAVFLAHDEVLQGPRAIKVLDPALITRPEARARFRTEAVAMSKLNHPNVIRVFDHGQEGLTSYIVMAYVHGGSIRQLLRREGALSKDLATSLCLDVCAGLQHAHENGIIHRDIKPDNILLAQTGALLTDFGIARVWDTGPGLTRSRATLGTPAYMAPEQRLDSRKSTPQSDLYSLGATLFVLLTNQDPIDLYEPHARETLLASVDPALAQVIRIAVDADPTQRFSNAQAMAEALEATRDEPGSQRSRPTMESSEHTAEEHDLEALHRLWQSYVTPQHLAARGTAGATYADPGRRPDEEDHTVAFHAHTDSDEAPTGPERPGVSRKGWRLPVTLLLGAGLGGLGIWMAQSASPSDSRERLVAGAIEAGDLSASPSVTALLDANPEGARILLERAATQPEDPAARLTHFLLQAIRGESAKASEARAQLSTTGMVPGQPLTQAIDLTRDSDGEQAAPNRLAARWTALTKTQTHPLVDVLHIVSMHAHHTPAERRTVMDRARSRHPTIALFAWLDVRLDASLPGTSERDERLQSALRAHPSAPALIIERGRALVWAGQLEAARETLQRLDNDQAFFGQALGLTATIQAQQGDRYGWRESMVRMSDDILEGPRGSEALRALGSTLASTGELSEAQLIWDFAVQLSDDHDHAEEAVETLLQQLQYTSILGKSLHEVGSFGQIRNRIDAAANQTAQSLDATARLLFWSGLQAAWAGDSALAGERLRQLQERSTQPGMPSHSEASTEVLAIEVALASPGAQPASLLAKVLSSESAVSSSCAWFGLQARIAARVDQSAPLREAATTLLDGHCTGTLAERELWSLHAATLLLAQTPSEPVDSPFHAMLAKRRDRWTKADEDLPLREQILATAGL